jgi:DNA-binding NtrC family response regulator
LDLALGGGSAHDVPMAATIVLVDKNGAFLDLAEQTLLAAGHRVLVTSNPEEALELAHRVRIDVFVADGAYVESADSSLLRKLQLAQPELRMLDLRSLGAPFSLKHLAEAIADLFGRNARPATDSPPGRLAAGSRG